MGRDTVISRYTREEAIDDGALVDVTEWASAKTGFMGGFTCSVVFTRALMTAVEAIPTAAKGMQDIRGRAHEVLFLSSLALCGATKRGENLAHFRLTLPRAGTRQKLVILRVVADDDGVTIGFPEDF